MRSAAFSFHHSISTQVIGGNFFIAIMISLVAGLISFFSPCILPLVPGYLSYAAGMSDIKQRGKVVLGAALFVLGFTVLFSLYGALFGGIGSTLLAHQALITKILGIFTIAMGLLFIFNSRMYRSFKPSWKAKYGVWGAPLLGFLFGFGWTPCIGPTLSAVESLALQSSSALRGTLLSIAYCLGIGVPFVIFALFFEKSQKLRKFLSSRGNWITIIGGVFLIAIGILQVTGEWNYLMNWIRDTFASFTSPL